MRVFVVELLPLLLGIEALFATPAGCKPPELVISPEHPLIILYGPGTGELRDLVLERIFRARGRLP